MTTIEFNKKLTCGSDFVAVKVIDTLENLKFGNIYLPDSVGANGRLAHCLVENVGKNAADKLGIKSGDYVMIDRLSTFAWTAPSAALKYDSVICKTNENKTEFFPLKDTLFIESNKKEDATNVNGIYVVNYDKRLNTGKITKTGFEKSEEYPFEPGQEVMLVKGGDQIDTGNGMIQILKKDMIVCVIEDK